jgi:diaminopimelate decarboxylase
VEFVKPTQHKNFLIVDAAMNDLIRPALYEAHHEVVALSDSAAPKMVFDVVGPICESADVLAHSRELAVGAGELIAFLSAGAYGFVMASNYNSRPRAAEVIVEGSNAYLVRNRETIESLFADEHLLPGPTN